MPQNLFQQCLLAWSFVTLIVVRVVKLQFSDERKHFARDTIAWIGLLKISERTSSLAQTSSHDGIAITVKSFSQGS